MQIEELKTYQKDICKFLLNARRDNKLVHAYLFEGQAGSGTYQAGLFFAMMMLCDKGEPCFKCSECEKIMYNSHINVIVIEPIDNMIKRDQIEYLMKDFSRKSFDNKPLIYIIKDADKMNTASENALLKILEEPAPNHYAVLTTENKNNILDTIISRCQVFHFNSPTNEYVEEYLVSNKIDRNLSLVISNYIYDPQKALELSKNQTYIDIYNLAYKVITNILNKKDAYVDYYLNKELLNNLEEHRFFITTLIIILKEIVKCQNEQSNYFENIMNNINKKNLDISNIYQMIDTLIEQKNRIEFNVNMNLFYSALFSRLK